MGYDRFEANIYVTARVSRHNDERDARHNDLWDDMMRRCTASVEAIVSEDQYQEIEAGTA